MRSSSLRSIPRAVIGSVVSAAIICAFVLGTRFVASAEPDPAALPEVSAGSAILIDADTGEIIYEKGSNTQWAPGKFAQIMTAMIAIETLSPDDVLTMDMEVYNAGGWQLFLQAGEDMSANDLIYATLLHSSSDAPLALAKGVSETTKDFVDLMNSRARALGCTRTTFVNVDGAFAEGQVSTVRDLAVIAQAAMNDQRFRAYLSVDEYTIPNTNLYERRKIENMNIATAGVKPEDIDPSLAALISMTDMAPLKFDNATGINARRPGSRSSCLIASGTYDGKNYLALVFTYIPDTNGEANEQPVLTNEYADAITLLNYGFSRMGEIEVFGELLTNGTTVAPGIEGLPEAIRVGAGQTLVVELPVATITVWESQDPLLSYEFSFNRGLVPPLEEGVAIGTIRAKAGEEVIAETDMILLEGIEAERPGFLETIGLREFRPEGISFYLQVGAAIVILLVAVLLIVLIRHRYTHDPYVRKVRYGRTTREIKRVRRLR